MVNKKLDFEIDGVLYNYKLFDTLKAINETKSQRKAAKQLNISHTVLNKRILKADIENVIWIKNEKAKSSK